MHGINRDFGRDKQDWQGLWESGRSQLQGQSSLGMSLQQAGTVPLVSVNQCEGRWHSRGLAVLGAIHGIIRAYGHMCPSDLCPVSRLQFRV